MPRIALIVALVSLAGCRAHTPVAPDDVVAPDAPAQWSATGAAEAPDRWWTAFGDAGLDALMVRVEADNLGLAQAWARFDRARAEAGAASAGWWPTMDAGINATRQRSAFIGEPVDITRYQTTLAARYEIDAWGRVASLTEAADWQAAATRLDVDALAMSLSASVADTWFELSGQLALEALLAQQAERNAALLDRLEQRFAQGLATSVAVSQQRSALLATRSALPPVRARIVALRHQLALLAGRAPGADVPGPAAVVPAAPALPATGVPGEVLRRRPDLRAARHRVAAADALVGAALAERFPTFALSASIGTGGTTPSALIEQWLWSLVAEVAGPIIDGGRRAAVVDQRRAAVREGLAGLGQAWLVALGEVEGALAAIEQQTARLTALEAEATNNGDLVNEAEARYLAGLGDYLPVVSAIRGHQAAERALLAGRVQLLRLHVTLHRALGGGWSLPEPKTTEADG